MTVVWTVGAADDLANIVEYIAQDDAEAARRTAKKIFDDVMSLTSMPHRGRKRLTDTSRELVFTSWPYIAAYEVIGDKVFIKAIHHTSRNLPR